jgi:hypothetical protein
LAIGIIERDDNQLKQADLTNFPFYKNHLVAKDTKWNPINDKKEIVTDIKDAAFTGQSFIDGYNSLTNEFQKSYNSYSDTAIQDQIITNIVTSWVNKIFKNCIFDGTLEAFSSEITWWQPREDGKNNRLSWMQSPNPTALVNKYPDLKMYASINWVSPIYTDDDTANTNVEIAKQIAITIAVTYLTWWLASMATSSILGTVIMAWRGATTAAALTNWYRYYKLAKNIGNAAKPFSWWTKAAIVGQELSIEAPIYHTFSTIANGVIGPESFSEHWKNETTVEWFLHGYLTLWFIKAFNGLAIPALTQLITKKGIKYITLNEVLVATEWSVSNTKMLIKILNKVSIPAEALGLQWVDIAFEFTKNSFNGKDLDLESMTFDHFLQWLATIIGFRLAHGIGGLWRNKIWKRTVVTAKVDREKWIVTLKKDWKDLWEANLDKEKSNHTEWKYKLNEVFDNAQQKEYYEKVGREIYEMDLSDEEFIQIIKTWKNKQKW